MKTFLISLLLFFLHTALFQNDFISSQKKFARVRSAYSEKYNELNKTLEKQKISIGQLNILILVFKHEKQLFVYAKNRKSDAYKKIMRYDICSSSGKLGPKQKLGDYQVPEGFYQINRFNPSSSYYLSLGINYPNKADRKRSNSDNLGGDIFIHGECVTIGCLPMTNDKIKEIYLLAVQAKNAGQDDIPVYIFPCEMTADKISSLLKNNKNEMSNRKFWQNIKVGYNKFFKNYKELKFTVSTSGTYQYID